MTESNGDVVVVPGRFNRSPALGNLAAAMARAQQSFEAIGKDKTAKVESKRTGQTFTYDYADLATCLAAVVPALSKEAIALFQPVVIEADKAIATTLLVHDSGEWMSSDFAVAIVDVTDARSVGSAATYGRRYGLLGMLAVAPSGEDDDAEGARGGAHEQAASKPEPACPACGVVGSLMKGAAQYGGGILCWAKRGGCGAKWPEGIAFPPTALPPADPAPTSGRRGKKVAEPVKAAPQSAAGEQPAGTVIPDPAPVVESTPPPIGSEDCETEGCWGGRGHIGDHVLDADADALKVSPTSGEGEGEPGPQSFMIGTSLIETAGMTKPQFEESLRLATAIDKGPLGKGYSRGLLAKMLHVPVEQASRKDLTQEQGERYLAALRQAATAGAEQK